MRKRPLALIAASCLFLCFPLSLVWKHLQQEPVSAADLFLSGFLPLLLTISLIRVDRIAWYTLFGFVFLWGIRDFQGVQSEAVAFPTVLLHVFIYLLGVSYFINPRIKRLYFDPKLQWWRTKRRYEMHGPAIFDIGNKTFYPTLKNISEGGCFLETPHIQPLTQEIDVLIPFPIPFQQSSLKVVGQVRWISTHSGIQGMGIQFLSLSPEAKKALKRLLAHQ